MTNYTLISNLHSLKYVISFFWRSTLLLTFPFDRFFCCQNYIVLNGVSCSCLPILANQTKPHHHHHDDDRIYYIIIYNKIQTHTYIYIPSLRAFCLPFTRPKWNEIKRLYVDINLIRHYIRYTNPLICVKNLPSPVLKLALSHFHPVTWQRYLLIIFFWS